MWGFDVTPRSRSWIVLIRRWAMGGMGKPVVRAAMPRSRLEGDEGRDERGAEGSTPGPGLARRTFPVNGERRPRASIQSGWETTLGPRVVHYSLRCPSLFPSSPLLSLLCRPSSLLHSFLAARSRFSHPSSSYFFGLPSLYYLLFCHCYYLHYYYMLVITGFRI